MGYRVAYLRIPDISGMDIEFRASYFGKQSVSSLYERQILAFLSLGRGVIICYKFRYLLYRTVHIMQLVIKG